MGLHCERENERNVDTLKNSKNKVLFRILLCVVFTVCVSVLAVFTIANAEQAFFVRHTLVLSILAAVLCVLVGGLWVWFAVSHREVLYKTTLSAYLFLVFVLGLILILQRTGFFRIINDSASLQNYLQNSGRWMAVVYVALQYLQVVVLPIPAIVSTVAGVALFGAVKTTVYSLIGILLGSFTAFMIGRKLGGKAVAWIVGKDELHKWQRKLKGKDNLVLSLMFFLPLFPDDVLCFLAGLSSMSLRYFLTVIFFARSIGVAATCFSFDFIPFNTWWGILVWVLIIVTVLVTVVLVYKNMEKIHNYVSKHSKKRGAKK